MTETLGHPREVRYLGAAALALAALIATTGVARYVADVTPFAIFYVAVTLSALYWGLGPALVSGAVGILGVSYFLLPPIHSFRVARPADGISVLCFATVAYVASTLIRSLRVAHENAQTALATAARQAVDLARANHEFRVVTAEAERARAEADAARVEADTARTEAEHANAAKSQFLAAMSHEMLTPINAVLGFSELLREGIAGPLTPYQQDCVRRIGVSSRRLGELVADILDLSDADTVRLSATQESGYLLSVVGEAVTLIGPIASERQLRVDAELGGEEIAYIGDPSRVRQIVGNLLSNAVKFTPPGGRIVVECTTTALQPLRGGSASSDAASADGAGAELYRWACVRVADSGIGIRADQLEAIFQPFVQGAATLSARSAGAGLGLTVSRRLARLMGGDVTVQSTPGAGSVFTLWLHTAAPKDDRSGLDAQTAERDRAYRNVTFGVDS